MPVPKRKLLLADDSITIQKVVNLTFADEGIEVITAGDGDAAMQKFVETKPDLVMVDVNMPGMDGYRICELIKQDGETKRIPVILLVGSFEPFDEEEARRVGADDYLTKPFQSIRQLVNKVSLLLDSGKTEAAADEAFSASTDEYTRPDNKTLELPTIGSFGDAGMDDDMIHTNQISIFPVVEERKFEANTAADNQFFDFSKTPLKKPYDFNSENPLKEEDDFSKTQPFTAADLDEITQRSVNAGTEKFFDTADKPSFSKRYIIEEPKAVEKKTTEAKPFSEPVSADEKREPLTDEGQAVHSPSRPTALLNFDDFNLLELPVFENEKALSDQEFLTDPTGQTAEPLPEIPEILEKMPETSKAAAEMTPEPVEPQKEAEPEAKTDSQKETEPEKTEPETQVEETSGEITEPANFSTMPSVDNTKEPVSETKPADADANDFTEPASMNESEKDTGKAENVAQSINFTPELIEAIAAKVAEKISQIAVREITSEVTPQMVELIIKQMAEEKMKE